MFARINSAIWGNTANLTPSVFHQWSQGFVTSDHERSALVQLTGGPCSVICAVQAMVLKQLLFISKPKVPLANVTDKQMTAAFKTALCEMLMMVASSSNQFIMVEIDSKALQNATTAKPEGAMTSAHQSCPTPPAAHLADVGAAAEDSATEGTASDRCSSPTLSPVKRDSVPAIGPFDMPEKLYPHLKIVKVSNLDKLKEFIKHHVQDFKNTYGVLIFLYSMILTKTIDKIEEELADCPLIDSKFGHASQSLINLLMTGQAVSNVWDGEHDIDGFKLIGISQRSDVGFLSYLEHLRYCEIGYFLKTPKYPIWLLATETHLTVLFSEEPKLAELDRYQEAQRIFKSFQGPEDTGFIDEGKLPDLLKALNLPHDDESARSILETIDPEGLGVILMKSFLLNFYQENRYRDLPQNIPMYHYNGLAKSAPDDHVSYCRFKMSLRGHADEVTDDNETPFKGCINTKWPTADLTFTTDHRPCLN